MLGLRTTHKNDIDASPAEMLYGQTLRLPGEMFENIKIKPKPNNESEFLTELCEHMQKLRATTTAHHAKGESFVHKALASSSHVFLQNDKVKSPLTQPYDGPFKVIRRDDKHYKIEINGR